MTLDEALRRPTIPIPEAGRLFFGIGRQAAYEAARRGDIETIDIGGRKLALVVPLAKRVGLATSIGGQP